MKNYIIVGGSKGIGQSMLKNLVESNQVYNISRSIPELVHQNLESFQLDVLKDELPDIEKVDGLIYCPGSITLKPISSLKEEDFLNDFNINLIGAVKTIKKYLKPLKLSGHGNIVLFSTVAVGQGMPFHSSIAVAKAGVEALTKSLAAELAPSIRVNCVAPTITNTQLASSILRNEKSIESLKQRHPLKEILEPEDVADLALFLASEKATKITGQIMGIDSGMSTIKL